MPDDISGRRDASSCLQQSATIHGPTCAAEVRATFGARSTLSFTVRVTSASRSRRPAGTQIGMGHLNCAEMRDALGARGALKFIGRAPPPRRSRQSGRAQIDDGPPRSCWNARGVRRAERTKPHQPSAIAEAKPTAPRAPRKPLVLKSPSGERGARGGKYDALVTAAECARTPIPDGPLP